MAPPLLARGYVDGIYIPSALLLVGIWIVKSEWLPYAAAVALALGGYKFFNACMYSFKHHWITITDREIAERKVLNPKDFQKFELKEKTVISHNTAMFVSELLLIESYLTLSSYRFALPRPQDVLGLPIGQHISLAAEIPGAKQNPVMRSYTPISSDVEPGYFDLLIKSYPTGNISKVVANLRIGETMKVKGPKGAMVYKPNLVRRFGMIAGGTGITPMLQIIKAISRGRASGDNTEVDLIFANVNPEDILLKEDLDGLVANDPKIRVYYVLNNPSDGWKGGVGFVTAEMIKERLPAPAKDIKILLCGPPPMIAAMKKATASLGYDEAGKYSSKLEDQVFAF